jgi:hypothetical protein
MLEAGHPFSGDIAEQQADAEQQHQCGGAEFQAAHNQRAAALLCAAQAPGEVFRRYRDDGNGRDRDRGAEPHYEGRGNARPEQALGQREYQNQNGSRTWPDANGEDGSQAAPPAAGTGELAWRGTMGMAAMLVMDVGFVVMVVVVMFVVVPVVIMAMLTVVMRVVMMGDLGVSMRVIVVVMIMSVAAMIVMHRQRQRRYRLR